MKKILLSVSVLTVVVAGIVGATIAFYNDTETSTGNIFTAGSIDLKVDHTFASYNGKTCVCSCKELDDNLILNGGFEDPDIAAGTWQVYPTGIPNWGVVSGGGIEIQDHAAGDPHSGGQLAELDSHGSNSKTTIKQVITTIPGQHYRLKFWHSARPGNNAGDNMTRFAIKVTSTDGVIINDIVFEGPIPANQQTQWTEYVYNFIALNDQTTIQFADAGNEEDTYGGYIDDVSVVTLDCEDQDFPYGGVCSLWGERDLGEKDSFFWYFPDIKPGDFGANTISLHVYDNDAYACLFPNNVDNDENVAVDPELALGDSPVDPLGELSGQLEFFIWNDENNNHIHDANEEVFVPAGTPFSDIQNEMIAMDLKGGDPISLIGIKWCAGTQTGPQNDADLIPVTCDGNGMTNIVQTDKLTADFVAYAIQQRNNAGFSCENIDPNQLPKPE